jgi:hypothetical protein
MDSFNPFRKGGAAAHAPEPAAEAEPPAATRAPQAPPPQQPQQQPPQQPRALVRDVGMDCLRPCRVTWNALMRGLASTKAVTGLAVALPAVYLIVLLAIANSPQAYDPRVHAAVLSMEMVRSMLTGVVGVISAITFLAAALGGLSVWQGLQNLLGIAAYMYTLLGHWFAVTILIVLVRCPAAPAG